MIRFISAYGEVNWNETGSKESLILDEMIWKKGRDFFIKYKETDMFPVLNRQHKLIGFAWQDREANRELRMLRELEACKDALQFHDLHPNCTAVTIHGFNELAWHMLQYLKKDGILVNVEGDLWKEIGVWENYEIPVHQNYEIWAEGIHQRSGNWKKERLRSASVEFECVDEIYEANLKIGKIKDAEGNAEDLIKRLRKEKEIVICGIGTKAQDAYDWLLSNGVDICSFQSNRAKKERKSLFGKPILRKKEVEKNLKEAIIIECAYKHSSSGFGGVDDYDYEGYERNKKYLLLRDYIEVPENNLAHILIGRKLIFMGDVYLCNRLFRWWKRQVDEKQKIEYWDILQEYQKIINKFQIPETDRKKLTENSVYVLVLPQHFFIDYYLTTEAKRKYDLYAEKLVEHSIFDYTDYFSDMMKSIHLEKGFQKYHLKQLRPAGIVLGVIQGHCGNVLIKQSLDGHPQIMMVEGHANGRIPFLETALYNICTRLAECEASVILSSFWAIYSNEVGETGITSDFPNREKFHQKMEELLCLKENFTSQELFVIFHIAYETMYGREVSSSENICIYWEPHWVPRTYVREYACWLGSSEVEVFTLGIVRNRYIVAGSWLRWLVSSDNLDWAEASHWMYDDLQIKNERIYEYWKERVIKFEDFKCNPKETLLTLCEWIGILFDDILMSTTEHGEQCYFEGRITGFDTRPVYNLYEEYFTCFDRMRISLIASSYQKKYDYPYVSCLDFSRRELQEMFLKSFRWETLQGFSESKDEEKIWEIQNLVRSVLWLERFKEVNGKEMFFDSI